MEVQPPRLRVHIPVRHGKRRTELEIASRGEARALIAAIAQLMYLLPDDGGEWDAVGLITLPASWLTAPDPVEAEMAPWALAELMEAIAPMDRAALRAVILDLHDAAPMAVEDAVNRTPHTMEAPPCPSRKDGEPCTVRGAHQWHYGPADHMGSQRMWEDSEADPQDAVPRHPGDPGQDDDPAKPGRRPWPPLPDACGFHGGEGKPGPDRCRECARIAAERKADTEMTPVSYLPLSSERLHGARIGGAS